MGFMCAECKISALLDEYRKEGSEALAWPETFESPCGNTVEAEIDDAKLIATNRPHELGDLFLWVRIMKFHGCPVNVGGLFGGRENTTTLYDIDVAARERHWGEK